MDDISEETFDEIKRLISLKKIENYPKAKMPLAIGLTKSGSPRHPLYMHSSSYLTAFQLWE